MLNIPREIIALAAQPILKLPRLAKQLVVVAVDLCLCIIATWLAFYLRLGEFLVAGQELLVPIALSAGLAIPVFAVLGLYRTIFRHSGLPAVFTIAQAMTVYGLVYVTAVMVVGVDGIPRTIGLIQPLILFFGVSGSRLVARLWLGNLEQSRRHRSSRPRTLIYGAGSAGRQLAQALTGSVEFDVLGYVDDDDRLHGHVLNGLPIYGSTELGALRENRQVTDVLLAIPSVSRTRRNQILSLIAEQELKVRTLPSVIDLAEGRVQVADLKELDIDDLLGRDAVPPNQILLARKVTNQCVLVTGAGGSIGSELCRQILGLAPTTLILVEISEFALYSIHEELLELQRRFDVGRVVRVIPVLCSVQDSGRIHEIMSTWRPDTVYHAAAYKHVPLVEHNLSEGVKNNVYGTLAVARAAIASGVSDCVLISTDKAVRPTNVMGATKRLSEMTLQALSANSETRTCLSMVRFGNVLASSGSVIPKFRGQIREGGPVTVTHPEVNRFFMTIPEAAQLVIQASALASRGDVFVLDMGKSVKILDLARRMIRLSGLTIRDEDHPDGDIAIEITGLRPGEKLYEELLIGDNPSSTTHPKIMRASEHFIPWDELEPELTVLKRFVENDDVESGLAMLRRLVVEFNPEGQLVDWLHLEQNASGD